MKKRHHFIPEVIQKHFTSDPNKIFIWRFDKNLKIMTEISIKDNALEKHLYSYKNINGTNITLIEDEFFAKIDYLYNNLIKMIEDRSPIEKIKGLVISIYSSLYSRVPKQIKNTTRMSQELHDFQDKYNINENSFKEKDIKKGGLIGMFALMDVHMHVMYNSNFKIFISNGDNFISCDNPADGAHLPLTKKYCLLSSQEKYQTDYEEIDDQFVGMINSWTYENADNYIYGSWWSIMKTIVYIEKNINAPQITLGHRV
ncbi:MAG: DUF4238 domain-containing protein [Candidatus Magasanikiibacteriota bacterium]